jgi:hypothetical protein
MRIFEFLARILLAAAIVVLALKLYATLDSASELAGSADAWAYRADSIAGAIKDAGILLALAGGMLALDRRMRA